MASRRIIRTGPIAVTGSAVAGLTVLDRLSTYSPTRPVSFGWGFLVWSGPMVVALGLLWRADPSSWRTEDRAGARPRAGAVP